MVGVKLGYINKNFSKFGKAGDYNDVTALRDIDTIYTTGKDTVYCIVSFLGAVATNTGFRAYVNNKLVYYDVGDTDGRRGGVGFFVPPFTEYYVTATSGGIDNFVEMKG